MHAVTLTVERIQDVLEDAVHRGRITGDDAQELAQTLVRISVQHTEDLLQQVGVVTARSAAKARSASRAKAKAGSASGAKAKAGTTSGAKAKTAAASARAGSTASPGSKAKPKTTARAKATPQPRSKAR